MNATINEIARHSEKSSSIAQEAVKTAKDASSKIKELGMAAQDIGHVTTTIAEISEQRKFPSRPISLP